MTASDAVRLAPVTPERLDDAVAAHQAAYARNRNLSHYLGPAFVRTTFQFFCEREDGYGILLYVSGALAGFVIGGSFDPFAALNSYRKRAAVRALAVRPWLWGHPRVGGRLIARTVRSGPAGDLGLPQADTGFGLIYSIAVVPAWSGQGFGRRLMSAFEAETLARGGARVIIPIGTKNAASLRMAEHQGYQAIADAEYDGNLILQKHLSIGMRERAHKGQ